MSQDANLQTVARAAVYLLALAKEEGDVAIIPLEHWRNFRRVLEACLLAYDPQSVLEAEEALQRYDSDPEERKRIAKEVEELLRRATTVEEQP